MYEECQKAVAGANFPVLPDFRTRGHMEGSRLVTDSADLIP